ncbi:hypothetical protein J6590_082705 [Homalodisca vitripennis]|nr:hypothetical protein J6590_082705 [Homalodisca vitripennis]
MPLHSNTSSRIFEKIYIDGYGPLPKTKEGYQYILIAVEDMSKFAWFLPLREITSVYSTVEEVSSKTADNAESAPACAGRQSSSGLRLKRSTVKLQRGTKKRRWQPREEVNLNLHKIRFGQAKKKPKIAYINEQENNYELLAHGTIGSVNGPVIIDTGAQISMIEKTVTQGPISPTDVLVHGITGAIMHTYGQVKQTIKLGDTEMMCTFIVADLPDDYIAVIGYDVLRWKRAVIDLERYVLSIDNYA